MTEVTMLGQRMHEFISELYPICRSITGDGVRETLRLIARRLPLTIHEVPSQTQVFDWTVPLEWNIRDAYIADLRGNRIVDFRQSNLHIMSYSTPVRRRISRSELNEHLYTLPEYPDRIPYRTTYYKAGWGFCVNYSQYQQLQQDEAYEVCIDATLQPGSLSYGEFLLPGETEDEVLISCHICHPSLCNDNLSGIALATFLALQLREIPRRYSYRFLFIPGTIGAITWLAVNRERAADIRHGLVVTSVGGPGKPTYKKSRRGNAEIDRAAFHVLQHSGSDFEVVDFSPYGYDERQYCSPGFDLNVGSLSRSRHSSYPEYHTSADNLQFVRPEYLLDSLQKYEAILSILEHNHSYQNLSPYCEPQLGKRGLYASSGGPGADQMSLLWVLNLSDGRHTLLDIAERSGVEFSRITNAAAALIKIGLLRKTDESAERVAGDLLFTS